MPLLDADASQRFLLVPRLSDLVFELLQGMGNYTNILQPIGKLRNLQTLHLSLYYYKSVRLDLAEAARIVSEYTLSGWRDYRL